MSDTQKVTRTIYDSDHTASQKDKEQAEKMFMKDGAFSMEELAAEAAYQRRVSYSHTVELKVLRNKVDATHTLVEQIHRLMLGQPEYKIPGVMARMDKVEKTLSEVVTSNRVTTTIAIAVPTIFGLVFGLIMVLR